MYVLRVDLKDSTGLQHDVLTIALIMWIYGCTVCGFGAWCNNDNNNNNIVIRYSTHEQQHQRNFLGCYNV